MSETAIKIEKLSKLYRLSSGRKGSLSETISGGIQKLLNPNAHSSSDEFWALKDVSFEIKKGEALGVIGKNGAGKSTLLKILSRITEPTSGRVEIDGRISSLLEVGTGFHPELSGRENIFLNGTILGMRRSEIRSKFDEIVNFSGVEKFLDTPVKRYSSGMYVRLAFAVAAHLEPEILIIDEVLAVGDIEFQKKCLGKMNQVTGEGRTVLFVSHNMQAVQKLCTNGVLLQKGTVKAIGPIDHVIDEYLAAHTSEGAVYDLPLPQHKEEVPGYAYKLTIEDREGNKAPEIPVGKPWKVTVAFRMTRKTEHFIIALGFNSSLDVPLRTSYSKAQEINAGYYKAVFYFDDIIWAVGKYNLILGMSSYERSFHYIENAGQVTIADVSDVSDNERIIRNSGTGLVLNPVTIDIIEDGTH